MKYLLLLACVVGACFTSAANAENVQTVTAGQTVNNTWGWGTPCVDSQGALVYEPITFTTTMSPQESTIGVQWNPNPGTSNTSEGQTISTTNKTPAGTYKIVGHETGTLCNTWVYKLMFNVQPSISASVSGDLYWFNGAKPQNYPTDETLTTSGVGPWTWTINSGKGIVAFPNGSSTIKTTGNTVKLKAVAASLHPSDVNVTVAENGISSAPLTLSVREPQSLTQDSNVTQQDPKRVWKQLIEYIIVDQFCGELNKAPVEVLEHWDGGVSYDYTGSNWVQARPVSITTDSLQPSHFVDMMRPQAGGDLNVPLATFNDPEHDLPVMHWPGDIQVGSATPGSAVVVQNHIWQFYQGHGNHEAINHPFPPCHSSSAKDSQ